MTDTRLAEIETFLQQSCWGGSDRAVLAGDASARRYFRLTKGVDRAVLMDADSTRGESVGRFLAVGRWLLAKGYSAPQILALDEARGFLLLEDLGDDLVARLVAADPHREVPLYQAVVAFLADMHHQEVPGFLSVADGPVLADLVELAPKWYLPGIGAAPGKASARIGPLIADLYARMNDGPPVVSLRDFHAENLIWLPDRSGVAKVGILDFQDAFATHPAYDLVSLLQDARRDVSLATETACIAGYCRTRGLDQNRFVAIYALLGAQRALRIIGVFARLSMHFGKPRYLDFAPRVWGHLDRNLAHPALAELADVVQRGLPRLNPERLQRIADKCGTYPQP